MSTERSVRLLAGVLILLGLLLGQLVNEWFLLIVAFVGLNLAQSAFTGFCPAEKFFQSGRGSEQEHLS